MVGYVNDPWMYPRERRLIKEVFGNLKNWRRFEMIRDRMRNEIFLRSL